MELTLATLCATGLLITTLLIFGGSMVRGPRDLILIFLLVYVQFYALRPVLFVLGLDTPSPDNQFDVTREADLLTTTVLGVTLFLFVTLVTVLAVHATGTRGWGPYARAERISLTRATRVTLALTALATVISVLLLAQYGGIAGLIRAAKVDKALAGMFVLRVVPSVGAIMGIATYLEVRVRNASRRTATLALACGLLNATYVFLWGSRSLIVVIAATVVLGMRRRGASSVSRTATTPRLQVLLRLTVAALVVVAIAGGLRIVRDTFVNGEVQEVYADASPARKVSLATNATYFDAAMLSFRDWPRRHEYRNGEDFVVGALGVVPRKLWAGKPAAVAPGRWFRQVYEPEKVNGWPMGAGALWYLNFGWLGVVLGGALSGLLLGLISAAQRHRPDNGFNTAVTVALGVYVLGLGADSDSLVRCIIWIVPLWAIARYVSEPEIGPRSRETLTHSVGTGHSGRA